VRMALGATRRQIAALVVREGVRHISIGSVVGVGIALVVASRIALLHGVSPHDPAVVLAAVGILVGGAAVAALVPAGRAMRTDPLRAMREE